MLYYAIVGALMLLSFFGMLFCAKKQSDNSAAKPLIFVFMIVLIVCGVLIIRKSMAPPDVQQVEKDRLTFLKSSAYGLAAHYADKLPSSSQVVVIFDREKKDGSEYKALKAGLEAGFPSGTDVVFAYPKVRTPPPGKRLLDILKARDLNTVYRNFPKANLFITAIGLPSDYKEMTIVKKIISNPDKTAPLVCLDCNIIHLKDAIKKKTISAAVVPNPSRKYSQDPPTGDPAEDFKQRFLLITPENVDQIDTQFPRKIFRTTVMKK